MMKAHEQLLNIPYGRLFYQLNYKTFQTYIQQFYSLICLLFKISKIRQLILRRGNEVVTAS